MIWRHAVYPVALLLSISGLAYADYAYRLAFWRQPRRALITMATALSYFIVWDICGIKLNVFYAANSTYRSGLLLGPSFPVEELLFLTLLCYTVLLGWTFRSRRR